MELSIVDMLHQNSHWKYKLHVYKFELWYVYVIKVAQIEVFWHSKQCLS